MATIGIFHQYGLPMTTFTAIAPEVTNQFNYPEVTRVVINADEQLKVSASALVQLGFKTFGVIRDNTAYGTSLDKAFGPLLENAGGKDRCKFQRVAAISRIFTAELTKLSEVKPQVIFIEGLAPLAIRVQAADGQARHKIPNLPGVSGIWSSDLLKNLGSLAEGTLSQRLGKAIEDLPDGRVFLGKIRRAEIRRAA